MKYKYKVVKEEDDTSIILRTDNKYCLKYEDNTIVRARSNTLGIFCFSLLKEARHFLQGINYRDGKIKRVIPLSRGKRPKEISGYLFDGGLDQFYKVEEYGNNDVPKGTICYQSVKVIGDVK